MRKLEIFVNLLLKQNEEYHTRGNNNAKKCSFCGIKEDIDNRLLAGDSGYICENCFEKIKESCTAEIKALEYLCHHFERPVLKRKKSVLERLKRWCDL